MNVGYATAEVQRKPQNALKFYSVEGDSVYKIRINRTKRHLKETSSVYKIRINQTKRHLKETNFNQRNFPKMIMCNSVYRFPSFSVVEPDLK